MLVHQILKQHRLNLEYQAKSVFQQIGSTLQVSMNHKLFKQLEDSFSFLDDKFLIAWLDALDISKEHHAWFLQTHLREKYHQTLTYHLRDKDPTLLKKIADILALLPDLKALKLIWEVAGAVVVENTLFKPRFVEIITDQEMLKRNE